MKLTLLPEADLEATEAAIWYENQRHGLGGDFLTELRRAVEHIRRAPNASAHLESYAGQYDIRRCLLERFPYLVIYACRAEETLVVAVSHVRREPLYWLERLGSE